MQIVDATQVNIDDSFFPEHDADEAMDIAYGAMAAAANLETGLAQAKDNPEAIRILAIAAEAYSGKYNLGKSNRDKSDVTDVEAKEPTPQPEKKQESEQTSDSKEEATEASRGRIAKTISYLYALAKNTFQYFFDFLRNQKVSARKIIPYSKDLIGRIDEFGNVTASGKITDRGVVLGLHIDGVAPRRATALYSEIATELPKINKSAGVSELGGVLLAAKDKNPEKFSEKSEILHDCLENGLSSYMNKIDNPDKFPAFREKQAGKTYYSTDVMFGQNYLTGTISECDEKGFFFYKSLVSRDPETVVRTESFPVLSPDEIRQICRTSLRLSEQIIEFSRDEDLIQKMMRDASFFITKEGGELAVPVLRNFVSIANNHYFAYLRYITRTMQLMMRWATLSVVQYEKERDGK